jgi:hypothetical protein
VDAPLNFVSANTSLHAVALQRAASWLGGHVVTVGAPSRDGGSSARLNLSLVAWWDPSLSANHSHLAAYTLSDTLWSSWALRQFDAVSVARLTVSLRSLGCESNGFFDQVRGCAT